MIEYGAFLFQNRLYSEAAGVFAEAKQQPLGSIDKGKMREVWTSDGVHSKVFEGQVHSIGGASAWVMALPENFQAHFFRDHTRLSNLTKGDRVKFTVGFNAYGAQAIIQEILPRRR